MKYQNPGSDLTTNNRFARLLLNQQNINNGTTAGGLAHVLQQGLAGYLMGQDSSDKNAAMKALMEGIKKPVVAPGMVVSDMGNQVTPEALADSGEGGAPGMAEQQAQSVMPSPPPQGGLRGGMTALQGVDPGNEYAGIFGMPLAMQLAKQQSASGAADTKFQRQKELATLTAALKTSPPKTIKTAEGVYILNPDGTLGSRLGGAKADTEINIGGDLSKGFRRTPTGDAEVIPGGSRDPEVIRESKMAERQAALDAKNIEKLPARRSQIMSASQNAPAFTDAVKEAKRLAASDFSSGVAQQLLGGIAGTPAFDLERQLDTIKSNIGFGELIRIKESGGTLGALSEMENRLLQAMQGALDPRLKGEQLVTALDRVEKIHHANLEQKKLEFKKMYPNEDRPWEKSVGVTDGTGETPPLYLKFDAQGNRIQ